MLSTKAAEYPEVISRFLSIKPNKEILTRMAALLDEGKIRTIVGCVPSQYSETWSALLACTESYSVMSEAEEIELLSILRPQFRV